MPTTTPFAKTPTGRIYLRLLELVLKETGATGLRLIQGAQTLLDIPGTDNDPDWERQAGEATTAVLFMEDYRLLLGKAPADLSASDRITLRGAEELMGGLGLAIARRAKEDESGAMGAISFTNLALIFLNILRNLENRKGLMDNYENILNLNRRILLAEDLRSVLQIIMDMAADATGGLASSLLLVDSRTGELYFNVISGNNKEELKEIRIPAGQGIAGSVVENARGEIIPDVSRDPRAFQRVDKILGQTTHSMMVTPILARGHVIGVIEVINSGRPGGFTGADLEFLGNIASQSGLLIENARGKEELIKSNQELDRKVAEVNALYEIGRSLNSTLDPRELKRALLRTIMKVLHVARGAILQAGEKGRTVEHKYGLHFTADKIIEESQAVLFKNTSDILLWMRQNREPFFFAHQDTYEGLVNRFREDNPEAFSRDNPLEVWIPISEGETEEIDFIISLGAGQLKRHDLLRDLVFFRSLMTQITGAFRNVASHKAALLARSEEKNIRQVFQKYVPPRVVNELLRPAEKLKPEIQIATILIADIRGSTRLAELVEPALLVELLNEFFEEMVPLIEIRGGIVDKFMGDAIMAVFGVPNPRQDDAINALYAARDMQAQINKLNERRARDGRPAFRIGVSLHTGPVIAGNLGARRRMDYTVIGDAANMAARLDKLSRLYRSRVLFTEHTLKAAGNPPPLREVDNVLPRGRIDSVRVYELLTPEQSALPDMIKDWENALNLYRNKEFQDALLIFQAVKSTSVTDSLADLYIKRCQEYLLNPPPQDWDGVFRVHV